MWEKKTMEEKSNEKKQCFVIMPIGEVDTYPEDHFKHVYEDLLYPAIKEAGYEPKRADDDKSSNMIQVSIIRDIVESPMAVCDLSTRNPNVLFELGVRQAFDLPVVLVQEKDTPRIFDISTINTVDYRKSLIYREVMEDRRKIVAAIKETKDNKKGINSIIKLLNLGKAQINDANSLSENEEINLLLYSLLNRFDKLENTLSMSKMEKENLKEDMNDRTIENIVRMISSMERQILRAYEKHGEKEAKRVIEENKQYIFNNPMLTMKDKKRAFNAIQRIEEQLKIE